MQTMYCRLLLIVFRLMWMQLPRRREAEAISSSKAINLGFENLGSGSGKRGDPFRKRITRSVFIA